MIDFEVLIFHTQSYLHSEFFLSSIKLSLPWGSQPLEADNRNHMDTYYFYSKMFHRYIKKEASTGGLSCVNRVNTEGFSAWPGVRQHIGVQ